MKKYFLFGAYLLLSLAIGEFHPFSQFPMYNSFPNYAYAFYLSNEKKEIVPYRKLHFNKNAGYVAHTFYSFCEQHHYNYGYNREEPEHLKVAGKELMDMILKQEDVRYLDCDTLKLYKRAYFLKDNRIQYTDQLMYEKAIHP